MPDTEEDADGPTDGSRAINLCQPPTAFDLSLFTPDSGVHLRRRPGGISGKVGVVYSRHFVGGN